MIHEGQLTFTSPPNQQSANIQTNPLPNHQPSGSAGINMLDIETCQTIKEITVENYGINKV